jgi:hypothetical protein
LSIDFTLAEPYCCNFRMTFRSPIKAAAPQDRKTFILKRNSGYSFRRRNLKNSKARNPVRKIRRLSKIREGQRVLRAELAKKAEHDPGLLIFSDLAAGSAAKLIRQAVPEQRRSGVAPLAQAATRRVRCRTLVRT